MGAVAAHDLADDGQAEPGALSTLFGSEEGIEDLVQVLLGDADAVIDHLQAETLGALPGLGFRVDRKSVV